MTTEMEMETFDELRDEILRDPIARAAAAENSVRRELARTFDGVRLSRSLSIRALAREMGTSVSQIQRLLHRERGGSLTLRTLFRAADHLDLDLSLKLQPKNAEAGHASGSGQSNWPLVPDARNMRRPVFQEYARVSAKQQSESVNAEQEPENDTDGPNCIAA